MKTKLLTHENFIAVGRMRYLEGMTYDAIAKQMGLHIWQVDRIANRAGFPSETMPFRTVTEAAGVRLDIRP